eukprot:5002333-Alexandrium_andersonii.AAC.1
MWARHPCGNFCRPDPGRLPLQKCRSVGRLTTKSRQTKGLQPATGPLQAVSGTFRRAQSDGKRRTALDSVGQRRK